MILGLAHTAPPYPPASLSSHVEWLESLGLRLSSAQQLGYSQATTQTSTQPCVQEPWMWMWATSGECGSQRRQVRVTRFFSGSYPRASGVWSWHVRWHIVDDRDNSGFVAIQILWGDWAVFIFVSVADYIQECFPGPPREVCELPNIHL